MTDANTTRPRAYGGTGGNSQETAAASLGYAIAMTAADRVAQTAGRGLIVGSFGIGGEGVTATDLDDCVGFTAIWKTASGVTSNTPMDISGVCLNLGRGGDRDTQIWCRHDQNVQYVRQRFGDSVTDWQQIVTEVERGGDATTGYVKYSNGQMKAWSNRSATLTLPTGFSGGFRSAAQTWTYPQAFSEVPRVTGIVTGLTVFGMVLGTPTATATPFHYVAPVEGASATRSCVLTAEGAYA